MPSDRPDETASPLAPPLPSAPGPRPPKSWSARLRKGASQNPDGGWFYFGPLDRSTAYQLARKINNGDLAPSLNIEAQAERITEASRQTLPDLPADLGKDPGVLWCRVRTSAPPEAAPMVTEPAEPAP